MIRGPNTHVEIDDIQFEVNKDKTIDRNRIKCRLSAAVNAQNQQTVVIYFNDVDVFQWRANRRVGKKARDAWLDRS